ncbi:MAG TPA: PAS domain S-box protein [Spirillospora sp.]|nr:PAS domain S-box protein [Spirillospora sp.]
MDSLSPDTLAGLVLHNLPDTAVLVFDHDLCWHMASGAGLMSQPPYQDVRVGRSLYETMSPAWIAAFEAPCRAALAGLTQMVEFVAAGQVYMTQVAPVRHGQQGVIAGVIVSRVAAQPVFSLLILQRYRALIDQTNDAVFLLDLDGGLLEWNRRAAQMLGYDFEDTASLSEAGVGPADAWAASQEHIARLKAGGSLPVYEHRFRHRNGDEVIAEVNLTLVSDDEGRPLYIQSVARDITTRKQAEAALRTSEERYRIISELISDFAYAFRVEPDGALIQEWMTEDSFRRITGYDSETLLKRGYHTLYHPDDRARVDADRQRLLAGEHISEQYRIITSSGELRWLLIDRFPVWDDGRQGVIRFYGVARDITEQKEVEIALRQSEERFRLVAKVISDGIYDWDVLKGRNWHSDGYTETFGETDPNISEIVGWFNRIHPDDAAAVVDSQMRAIHEGAPSWSSEYRMRRRDGRYATVADRALIVRDAQGRLTRLIGAITDITERKAAEKQALDLALQKEKVRILADFITAISHDFRTPLSVINTSVFLLTKTVRPEDWQRHLHKIEAQVRHIEGLVEGLLTMTRLDRDNAIEPEPFDLNVLVDDLEHYEREVCIEKKLALTIERGTAPLPVLGDRYWLRQALGNLIDNAIQYTPDGKSIVVRTYQRGGFAVTEVQDTGIGMSEEQLPYIFDPLYRAATHRPATSGPGLGLSITRKIVERHQGQIEVVSTPHVGTVVRVLLPLHPAE